MSTTPTNKKVLVVEDELPLRQALVDVLEFAQFAVVSAHNGEEGLALALKEEPDVILLDIIMPVMDGFSMLKKLRASGGYGAKVPVVVLSNLTLYSEDLEGDLNVTHPESYLLKTSWAIEDVVKKVESVLAAAPLS
jgi:two-component system OmpR family response regulator